MRLLGILFLFLLPNQLHAGCTEPGKARWPIKSSVISIAALGNPQAVALTDLLALADAPGVTKNDANYQDRLIPAVANAAGLKEGDIVVVEGWLHLVAKEPNDCEYHIQISASQTDGDHCLIVEVPLEHVVSVPAAGLRSRVKAVRSFVRTKLLKGKEPGSGGNVMQHPPYVRVVGQLFFDDYHIGDQPRGKKGMKAATLWEIHPIVAMEFAPPPS
jgi:hypothetical protein